MNLTLQRPDVTLSKLGYSPRTSYYHRVKFNGGFYTAFCSVSTRITHFAEVEEVSGLLRKPCKRCFPKGAPDPVYPEDKLEVVREKVEEILTTPLMNDQQQARAIIGFWNWLVEYLF